MYTIILHVYAENGSKNLSICFTRKDKKKSTKISLICSNQETVERVHKKNTSELMNGSRD